MFPGGVERDKPLYRPRYMPASHTSVNEMIAGFAGAEVDKSLQQKAQLQWKKHGQEKSMGAMFDFITRREE
jgi:hypothetical protein